MVIPISEREPGHDYRWQNNTFSSKVVSDLFILIPGLHVQKKTQHNNGQPPILYEK